MRRIFIKSFLFLACTLGGASLVGQTNVVRTETVGNDVFVIHEFRQVGTFDFNVPPGVQKVDILLVAGGGAGGSKFVNNRGSGGGGAGGVIERIDNGTTDNRFDVIPGALYNVKVGAGGVSSTVAINVKLSQNLPKTSIYLRYQQFDC